MKVRRSLIFVLVLVVAVAAAYSSSFSGGFVLDDHGRILENPSIRSLQRAATTYSHHYVAELTFAWDYAMGGLVPSYYHLTNLVIHLSCVLVLFYIVRLLAVRSCKGDAVAEWIAFISALLWGLHPLSTSAVTYICQRYESLMSLFYLLAMFFLAKGSGSKGRVAGAFLSLSVLSCLAGMFTKQVMITAPLALLLLDSSFLAGTPWKALRARRAYYAALVFCWAVQFACIRLNAAHAAIFEVYTAELGVLVHALNQGPVLLHYLKLMFWPHPLTLDYAWQPVSEVRGLLLPAACVGGVFGAVAYGFIRWPKAFFAAMCAFIVLSPTSSFVPIPDLAYEHRMYLPLACTIVSIVLFCNKLLHRAPGRRAAAAIALLLALVLGVATFKRNQDYADPEALWGEIARRIPHNFRAWTFCISEKLNRRDYDGAERTARQMLDLVQIAAAGGSPRYNVPSSSPVMYDAFGRMFLGRALMGLDRTEEALEQFRQVVSGHPDDITARQNMALALLELGFRDEAEGEIDKVLQQNPGHPQAGMIKVNLLIESGRHSDASSLLEALLLHTPDLTAAKVEYAWLLATSYDPEVRDGVKAGRMLASAEAEIGATSARLFEVRAAVSAEMGDFEGAMHLQDSALTDAKLHFSSSDRRIQEMERRWRLYKEKQAFRLKPADENGKNDK